MDSMKKKIAAFNWKLKPTSFLEAQRTIKLQKKWAKKYPNTHVIAALPMPFVGSAIKDAYPVSLSAQDVSVHIDGAHTGESSAAMLREIGCSYTIVGHSERRATHGETNQVVSQKASLALEQGLTPIVCFGESGRDESGTYVDEITEQLLGSLSSIPEQKISKIVLAYEPVWAIGSDAKRAVTTDELFSTMILIKNILTKTYGPKRASAIPILYGGSVKAHNADELAAVKGVDGFLVGGASHVEEHFKAIIKSLA